MFFQKEPKSLRIIILIIAACLVAGAALLIYSGKKPPLPKEEKVPAGIEVIETETGKIVRNKAEGYEVTVPKEWEVKKPTQRDEKIVVQKMGVQQPSTDTDLVDGVKLQIFIQDNPDNLSIEEWSKKYWAYSPEELGKLEHINIGSIDIIKVVEKNLYSNDSPWAGLVDYSLHLTFTKDKKYYDFYCVAVGSKSNSEIYIQNCEKIIIENIKKTFL